MTHPNEVETNVSSNIPSNVPSNIPVNIPSKDQSNLPLNVPSNAQSNVPSNVPSNSLSNIPSNAPSLANLKSDEARMAFIEAVLFVSKAPVEPEKLINYLRIKDIGVFDHLIARLNEQYQDECRGISITFSGGGMQITTKPQWHEHLKEFFTVKSSSRLSIASLETLAIIAYRQPVTIAEISDLRGVNSVGPVKNLLQKKLIRISGRKKIPGNPSVYSTTKEFLLYFGLNDISELPSLEELTEMFEEKEQPSLFKNAV